MYRHLLIATDGSDLAQQAVTHGLALAKELRARVTAVTVTDPVPPMVSGDASVVFPLEDYTRAAEANAARILDSVTAAAQTASVACDVVHVKDQFAAQGIFPPTHHRRPPLTTASARRNHGSPQFSMGVLQHIRGQSRHWGSLAEVRFCPNRTSVTTVTPAMPASASVDHRPGGHISYFKAATERSAELLRTPDRVGNLIKSSDGPGGWREPF
jgi:hypothetical protein